MSTVATGAEQMEFRDYLRVLRRRRMIIIAATVVIVATAVGLSLIQTPVYQGTAELLIQPSSIDTIFGTATASQSANAQRNVDTEIQVLKSAPVKDAVRKKLGSAPDISASEVGQTDVVDVRASSASPSKAAAVANAYANAYVDFKRQKAVDSLTAAGGGIQAQVDDLQRQIDDTAAQISNASAAQRPTAEQNLGPRRDALVSQQALLKQRLDQLQVQASLASGGAQVVTPATSPTSPFAPRPIRTGAIALGVGLVLGIGLAFLVDYLDDSIKTKDDLARSAPSMPVIGLVPLLPNWRSKDKPELVSISDPTSSAAESYRTLRTAIQFMGLDRPMRTVQVTSPSAAEGKTTTLTNLGVALARAGQRVVLVDCDLRRPRIHQFFGLANDVGFTSVLLGEVPLAEAVQEVPNERYIMVLASGILPPNPSELLSSQRTVQVLAALQAETDIVLIDSPPMLPVTDAAVLSARVDATLLVTAADRTTRKALARATELLQQVDAPLVGTVFNEVTGEEAYAYSYNYRYYARDREPAARGALFKRT